MKPQNVPGTRARTCNSWRPRPFQALSRTCEAGPGEPALDDRTTSTAGEPEMIEELVVQQLRDLLHAEGQLVKALPKMRETTHPVIALLLAPDRLVDIGHVHAPCTQRREASCDGAGRSALHLTG